MKTILLVCAIVTLNSCEKKVDKECLLQNEWKIKSISIDKKSLNPPKKTRKKDAYVLRFSNENYFFMSTSVNEAGGGCQIISDKNIIIIDYHQHTESCCENDFDIQMISVMNNVNSYHCKGNKLTFSTNKNEKIIFEKQ